ncbi:MAG: NIPSNAP family protein [Acetobacteraceae bacterium]|nr:NIPSNAP family protein [Acetobacteraceae bacterium]MSP30003.1 NIPSNAP family protein [Acetobacteraceae bacterium]
MIVEMRTYQCKPGTVPQFEERFGAALPIRQKISPLAGFFHTEVGDLNKVIHIWPYESFEARTKARAEATATPGWPPATREFVTEQQAEIFHPAPFSPKLEPRELGGIYEIRMYQYAAGTIPAVMEAWGARIAERVKLSPLVAAWYSEIGPLNKWVHIWAYKDANHRAATRAEAVAKGIWPPPGTPPGALLKMQNMLVVPAAFSPLR